MLSYLSTLLECSAARHSHLCPRQVLGVRMGLAGLSALRLEAPVSKASGLIIVETDGCFVDGIEVSTGATVGHRTLRVNDLGKIAATFVHVPTGRAVRLSPQLDARLRAAAYGPHGGDSYAAQLAGYQLMPDCELFRIHTVILDPSIELLLSRADIRAKCSRCGEEIINERQVIVAGAIVCRTCAGHGYYSLVFGHVDECLTETTEDDQHRGDLHEPTSEALPAVSSGLPGALRRI